MIVKRTKCFTVTTEDRPGELARFARHLRDAGVNLVQLCGIGGTKGQARINVVAEDHQKLKTALTRGGWAATEGTCFRVDGEDRVGVLCETFDRIGGAGVNIVCADAIAIDGRVSSFVLCEEKDVSKVSEILQA